MFGPLFERLTSRTFRGEYRAFRNEWTILRIHKAGVRKASSVQLPCKLHIGCGPNRKEGWINIDLDKKADLRLDMREALPFPDHSVTTIYGEHFFEHLSYEDGVRFVRECFRVLVPGGRLSLGVPDAAMCMQL